MARTRRISIITLFAVIALFATTFPGSSATMAGPGGCCPAKELIVK